MPQFGFIRDKLDVKVLVLYLAARVAAPIDFATLTDLCMCDEGVDYFMFAQAVSELVESEHLQIEEDFYTITDKGRKNGSVWEESLPFSVRQKCNRNLARAQCPAAPGGPDPCRGSSSVRGGRIYGPYDFG